MTHPHRSSPDAAPEPVLPGLDAFQQVAESIPHLVWVTRADGRHEYFNARWFAYTGLSPEGSVGTGWERAFHPDDLEEANRRWAHSLRTGEPYEVEYRCRRHDGVWRWHLGRAQPVRDDGGRILKWFGTCTDIEEQKRATDSMSLLAEASALLSSSSLDYEATLAALTRLVVPSQADWCAIEIAYEDGSTRQVGVAHVDPEKVRYGEELRVRYPPRHEDPSGVLSVIRTGEPVLLPEVPDALLVAGARDAEHLRIARELGLRSVMVLPLKARGRTIGALSLVHAESGRRFRPSDMLLASQLAERAAVALDNARLIKDARRMEERFRSLVTASTQAVWVTRPDGDIEEDSPSWRAYTGQTFAEWRGHGWLTAVHPEERDAAARTWFAAVEQRRPYESEQRLRRPEGHYTPSRVRAVPVLNPNGSIREWVGTTTDISAQRLVEEASHRAAREAAVRRLEALRADVSLALSREGTVPDILQDCAEAVVTHLAAQTVRLWLYARDTHTLELAGNAGSTAPPRDRWMRVRVDGLSMVSEVARLRTQLRVDDLWTDPRVLDHAWLREMNIHAFAGMPLMVRGQLVGALGVYRDTPLDDDAVAALAAVSDAIAQGVERRRAEESLQQHVQELARSNEELQQFAYVASHDLQEPLRMVASYTQLLGRRYKGKLDSDADEFIHYAVDGVNRMQRLIQDLLAYSRVGTRGKDLRPCDTSRAMARATANLRAAIEETHATVEHGPLPAVLADETQLTQLFQNLVGNALKFHGDAPPRVQVSAEAQGEEVCFTVRDFGIGIAPEYFERIFVIFQRLHGKEEYPGTGIGLAICKKIVERHGGRIGVESRPGEGTAFWFTLPAVPPHLES
ncbi:Phytochrome, two-component sensor histidine kinase [Myxococcus hansupus]|uniref:histidine kinase n=1 Tax=Pseudomyxococcus hansupus TaxID=1297742 RepID=A0A0H4X6R4_9BACT|nr:PAS domain-containing protein [Myxococcus hansupus]AKQ69285.1 Phytochrome, two-component sensor histidine kinase [Myxococcus hansupus]